MKTVNKSLKNVIKFRYLGMIVTDQDCIHEEIKSILNMGNACYHAVQYLLSSYLLLKTVKFKIHETIILPDVLYECESWSHTL
jgi:hypothetical protein